MAITTLDGALAGMLPPQFFMKATAPTLTVGRPYSLWNLAGTPVAGTQDGTLNGAVLTSNQGQIPFSNPGSGNTYLARFTASASQVGTMILADRLWSNGGISITSTSLQSITSPTWPARDSNGATLGAGVLIGAELSVATGSGTPTLTLGYTDAAGNSSLTATNIHGTTASSPIGSFFIFGTQGTGVRSVESIQLSSTWTSGTLNLVAFRVLAVVDISAAGTPGVVDAITGGFPRLYNNTVPFLIYIPSVTTAPTGLAGQVVYTQG